jgi:hypothetical protein
MSYVSVMSKKDTFTVYSREGGSPKWMIVCFEKKTKEPIRGWECASQQEMNDMYGDMNHAVTNCVFLRVSMENEGEYGFYSCPECSPEEFKKALLIVPSAARPRRRNQRCNH